MHHSKTNIFNITNNSLTKHDFTVNAKFAGDKPALHGAVLYTVHHFHPLVVTFF